MIFAFALLAMVACKKNDNENAIYNGPDLQIFQFRGPVEQVEMKLLVFPEGTVYQEGEIPEGEWVTYTTMKFDEKGYLTEYTTKEGKYELSRPDDKTLVMVMTTQSGGESLTKTLTYKQASNGQLDYFEAVYSNGNIERYTQSYDAEGYIRYTDITGVYETMPLTGARVYNYLSFDSHKNWVTCFRNETISYGTESLNFDNFYMQDITYRK